MCISKINDIMQDCPNYVLEDITGISMHIKLKTTKFMTTTLAEILKAENEADLC